MTSTHHRGLWLLALATALTTWGVSEGLSSARAPAEETGSTVTLAETALPVCSPLAESASLVFARSPGGSPEVDASWLAANRCHVRIVDVRQRAELEGDLGRIAEAEWAPLEELEAHAARWPSDQAIVLVDRSGRRASSAELQLVGLGLHHVASLTGGMLAWQQAGYPVQRGPLDADELVEGDTPEVARAPATSGVDPVRARLADPSRIEWVTVASIVGAGAQQCIDGRAHGPVVGTPGGDAGELALALTALERASHRPVPASAIAPTLAAYVEGFGRFYLHTDEAALARLGTSLASDPRFDAARDRGELGPGSIESFVRRPPPELEEALLDHLVETQHVGCGHLRLMLEHPSEYGVRRELLEGVLRESYRLGWSRPELLDFEVLEGEHEERAFVRVWLDQPVHAYTRVPTFPGIEGEGTAFFVAHPEVSAFLRRELGSFLSEHARALGLRAPREDVLQHELGALAERQVSATVRHLARELPVYEVHMHEGIPEVSGPNASLGCRDY